MGGQTANLVEVGAAASNEVQGHGIQNNPDMGSSFISTDIQRNRVKGLSLVLPRRLFSL